MCRRRQGRSQKGKSSPTLGSGMIGGFVGAGAQILHFLLARNILRDAMASDGEARVVGCSNKPGRPASVDQAKC
jgi:hypothetical protein